MRKKNRVSTLYGSLMMLLLLGLSVFLTAFGDGSDQERQPDEQQGSTGDGRLEMQGYYLDIPGGYECTGGFTDGYRFLDAECTPTRGADYKIVVEFGLASTAASSKSEFLDSQISVREHYLDGVCSRHDGEMHLDAEHYVCVHTEDGKKVVSMGIVKVFDGYARRFEAHLVEEDSGAGTTNEDYIDTLAEFLNQAIIINWADYE
ncbi:MAG TPA: hypothetical protein ENN46_02885 [Candidatus Woesearchaeota archaeon]|nr:hypothetical protein [Candidatus Woesearchaeota archaeon]